MIILVTILLSYFVRGSVQDNIGPYHENEGTEEHFTHEWVISTKGGSDAAKKIAQDLGYRYVGDVSPCVVTLRVVTRFAYLSVNMFTI